MLKKKHNASRYSLVMGALLLTAFSACQSPNGKAAQATTTEADSVKILDKEVMDMHNIAMPKMVHIRTQKQILTNSIDSLTKLKKEVPAAFTDAVHNLDSASNAMDVWMKAYDYDMTGKSDAEKITYLNGELKKIEAIKAHMESSIEQAKSVQQ
ncbi:hypothetical protein LX64_03073 [Chitinophaga skermanii]|uniref:Viral A-type inclusion protein n=1 Tax=Chitinophaga skermanii TaxID=331697 RepID=A0A327QJS3_9BACT|nr:hypothetical protein [Chitinophaga skermanii]RAJ04195.1 hypothetical protein LX64_03073 [Chitinophaga skermanii]